MRDITEIIVTTFCVQKKIRNISLFDFTIHSKFYEQNEPDFILSKRK
jgi:hypothetical protein